MALRHHLTPVLIFGYNDVEGIIVDRVIIGSRAEQMVVARKNRCRGDALATTLGEKILTYLDGGMVDFREVPLDGAATSDFTRDVLDALREVPYGTTCSYAELAYKAGHPRAVRAVASVLRKNRFPLIIPCHRVIRSNGTAGAFCGAESGCDADLKKALLLLEQYGVKKCL